MVYSDERVLRLRDRIFHEYYVIFAAGCVLFDIYQRFIVGRGSPIMALIFGFAVYKDVRFKKGYSEGH